jgi:class 3 adenylate cyclase
MTVPAPSGSPTPTFAHPEGTAARDLDIRYTRSGGVHIAYQTFGDGPVDLILSRQAVSQLEVSWEEPRLTQQFLAFARFSRLILFDKRGTGLSDRDVGVATLENRMDDLRAVLDAVGSNRAVVFGGRDGSSLSALFAATYPERTLALVLWGGMARGQWSPDYPWAPTVDQWEAKIARDESDWGTDPHIDRVVAELAPSQTGDAGFHRWLGRLIRAGASPAAGQQLARMNMAIDIRPTLAAIHVPTLVLHAAGDHAVPIECGRDLARRIPGAKFTELPTSDHLWWVTGEMRELLTRQVRSFVEQLESRPESDRVLTTVLFTDIVESTRTASRLGDRVWIDLLNGYLARAAEEVRRYQGRLVKTTGDGLLATFDGPTRAVRCATSLRDLAQSSGFEIRAGLHTGECLLTDGDVQGIAVHIAARVAESAAQGEVLVSSTVRDLSVGSEIAFVGRGEQVFRGVNEPWRVYAVGPPPS